MLRKSKFEEEYTQAQHKLFFHLPCRNNVRCKSSETNVEIACDLTEHGRNSIVFLSDRAESLD